MAKIYVEALHVIGWLLYAVQVTVMRHPSRFDTKLPMSLSMFDHQ